MIQEALAISKIDKINIFLVDDDVLYLKNLQIQFQEIGINSIKAFETGEKCIENISMQPDVIILDYHLDGIQKNAMNGLATLDSIKQMNSSIPVIMLSSQDKIEVAISCMHHNAYDYIVKSETAFMRLQKVINGILQFKKIEHELKWYMERM